MNWKEIPFFRLLIPQCIGILAAYYLNFYLYSYLLFFLIAFLISLQQYYKKHLRFAFRNEWISGIAINLLLFSMGNVFCDFHLQQNKTDNFFQHYLNAQTVVVRLTEPPELKENSYKVNVQILATTLNQSIEKCNGHAIVYFKKSTYDNTLNYGDEIICRNTFTPIAEPRNPDEFDFKNYLALNEFYTNAFLQSNEWIKLGSGYTNWFWKLAYRWRQGCVNLIEKYVPGKNEAAVTAGLILGYRSSIDKEIYQAYSASGVIHILAVSGMHIGLIYVLLDLILFFMNRNSKLKTFKSIIILILIWWFGLMTGLPGSVVRAATLFSFLTLGKLLKQNGNTYNTMSMAAFFILIFSPLSLLDVGFQLSYAAVIGIVSLQKPIYQLLQFKNKLIDNGWKLTSVSIAAQIATMPLTFFYFSQFPIYFMLSNLIVIPSSTIILYLTILLIVLSPFQWVATWLGTGIHYLVLYTDNIIDSISKMPYSVFPTKSFSVAEVSLIIIFMITIFHYFNFRKINPKLSKNLILTSCFSLLIFAGIQIFNHISIANHREIIVHSFNHETALQFVDGQNSNLLCNDALLSDENARTYFEKYWQKNGIHHVHLFSIDSLVCHACRFTSQNFTIADQRIQFYNHSFSVISKFQNQLPKQTEFVLIYGKPVISFKTITPNSYQPKLIFDNSTDRFHFNQYIKLANQFHIQYHSVLNSKSFIIPVQPQP